MKLGEYIKSERKAKKITQRELASKIGVDFLYISKIESGETKTPSDGILEKISKILDLDAEVLMLLSNRLPDEIREKIETNPKAMEVMKLLSKKQITESQWDEVFKILNCA